VPPIPSDPATNSLLDALPDGDRQRVLAGCTAVHLPLAEALYSPRDAIAFVYFPTGGLVSLVMPIDGSGSLDVGMVGSEGMLGAPVALGVDVSLVRAVVHGEGAALRMEASRFRRELARTRSLRCQIDRYLFVCMTQLAQAVACTRFHVVEARLARWLLMSEDRVRTRPLHLTHEILAEMLGVRRVGVTEAARSLQRRGLIGYRRGDIDVLDRRGLEDASCDCYRADRAAYDRVFGAARHAEPGSPCGSAP
jgi:CRP-like cAMP-binding protein